jgi:CRP-like cAMP-binding protein
MSATKTLLCFVNKFLPVSQEEFAQLIAPIVVTRQFEKKKIITAPGEIENYIYFIRQGLVRKYYKKDEEEVITQISREGQIIHVQESFHSRQPSEFFVETIEPSVLDMITYNHLEKLYASSHKMEHLGRAVATTTLVLKDKWQSNLIKLSCRERFIHFFDHHPELIQRVPQKYLASLLNIKPETFSRFKHLVKDFSKKEFIPE